MLFYKAKHSVSYSMMMMFFIIFLSLTTIGTCVALNQTLNYTDCTPQRNCLSCLNQYICKSCAPLEKCCPKKCISCVNDTSCTQCEPGFQIRSLPQKERTICANSDSYQNIDYHRIKVTNNYSYGYPYQTTISTKCEKGYFYENDIKFCQKCRVKNCELCKDSIHCLSCEDGFFLFNGLCLTWADVKQTFDEPVKNSTVDNSSTSSNSSNRSNQQTKNNSSAATNNSSTSIQSNQQTQQNNLITQINKRDETEVYQFFMILGLICGSLISCILIQVCSCIKGCFKRCCYCLLNKNEEEIVFVQETINNQNQQKHNQQQSNNRNKQNNESQQMNESFQTQSSNYTVITQSQPINKK